LPDQIGEARWVAQGLDGGKMLLQQQPRGEKDVFLVVDHEDAGGAGEGRSHVFVIGQVSARVYARAQLPAKLGLLVSH
jgi:hypothetical protein